MILLRNGEASDAEELCDLIFSTAPVLLPYLFGNANQANDYIKQALTREDGQYSAVRHRVAYEQQKVLGCIAIWTNSLPSSFYWHTELSLTELLTPEQVLHIARVNHLIAEVFSAPTKDQICIGHFAVSPELQGRGIGKKLLSYAFQEARRENKKQLVLDVDINNEDAVNFYIGMGFVLVSETDFKPTKQTFYRMQYTVTESKN